MNDDWNRFMNMFVSTWVLLVAGLVFALPMIHMRVQDSSREMDELCVFAVVFSPHFLRALPFFPRCLRRGLPCSLAPLLRRTYIHYRSEQEKPQRRERPGA